MADELGPQGIHGLFESPRPKPGDRVPGRERREGRREQEHNRRRREPKDYVRTMTKATERSNEVLEKKKLPFRFCIYEQDGDVYIDLVRLSPDGKVVETTRKNITHQDFDRWIQDVSDIEGLFIDTHG